MFERDFLGFINDNQLADSTTQTLLTVSGGLDSTVMAALFHRAGLSFAIAHVNFGLRGQESDGDALFVEELANRYQVPFHTIRFQTAQVAAERGESIQMVARTLRYQWFGEIRRQHGYDSVATAHQLNDVLETMLLNLTRGTGLAGLHGIAVRQEHPTVGTLIRPLLFASRDKLETYAAAYNLKHREDRSNADDYYARNRIRHHAVPVLTGINPGLWTTLPRTVERLRAAEQLMQLELNRSWQQLIQTAPDGAIRLPVDGLLALREGAFRLSEWLQPYGFTNEQARQAWTRLTREPGQQLRSATHLLTHERGFLLLSLLKVTVLSDFKTTVYELVNTGELLLDGQTLACTYHSKPGDFVPEINTAIAWLDADRLVDPLTIRVWQQGDRFQPLGLSGTKLVSDLLNELKLEQRERAQTLVLISGDAIAWVVGRRIGRQFRVRPDSQRLVRLELKASCE